MQNTLFFSASSTSDLLLVLIRRGRDDAKGSNEPSWWILVYIASLNGQHFFTGNPLATVAFKVSEPLAVCVFFPSLKHRIFGKHQSQGSSMRPTVVMLSM